jgi:hypothetical protein
MRRRSLRKINKCDGTARMIVLIGVRHNGLNVKRVVVSFFCLKVNSIVKSQ